MLILYGFCLMHNWKPEGSHYKLLFLLLALGEKKNNYLCNCFCSTSNQDSSPKILAFLSAVISRAAQKTLLSRSCEAPAKPPGNPVLQTWLRNPYAS